MSSPHNKRKENSYLSGFHNPVKESYEVAVIFISIREIRH